MSQAMIGVIGGSGLYGMHDLTDVEEVRLHTPYGDPSDTYIIGTLAGQRVAFLPRHGRGHVLSPTEVPAQANIYGFKQLGVRYLISVSAVGSLREDYAPGQIVIPDQIFDRTKGIRPFTFYGAGWWCISNSIRPSAPNSAAACMRRPSKLGQRCILVVRMCVWKARSSRPWPRARRIVGAGMP